MVGVLVELQELVDPLQLVGFLDVTPFVAVGQDFEG